MIVQELQDLLRGTVEVPEPSLDQIVWGDPSAEIQKVGTCWMGYWDTLKEANACGVNVMVVHEPIFYTHNDLDTRETSFGRSPERTQELYHEAISRKKAWLDHHHMAVIRCHDMLDQAPHFGVPFAWGRQLGFSDETMVASKPFYNVYERTPERAIAVADEIARRVVSLGQQGVAFHGDPDRTVRRIAVGTGCCSSPLGAMDLEADLYIGVDDIIRNWVETTFSRDTGSPLIVLNHGTAEEAGVRELSQILQKELAPIEVVHFPQGCTYRWVVG